MSHSDSLYHSLLRNLLLVAVLPLLLAALVLVPLWFSDMEREVADDNRMLAKAVVSQAQLFLEGPKLILNTVAANIHDHPTASPAMLAAILDDAVEASKLFDALYLSDHTGVVIAAGLPVERNAFRNDYVGIHLGHKPVIKKVLAEQGSGWSETFLSPLSGKTSVALAMAVKGGVLIGDLDLSRLSTFVAELQQPGRGAMIILDRLGQVIAHPQQQLSARQINLSHLELVQLGMRGASGEAAFLWDGVPYIGSVMPISTSGWMALVAERRARINAWVTSASSVFAGVALFGLLLSIGLSTWIARRLARPVEQLAQYANGIAHGNYQLSLPHVEQKELHRLVASMQAMGNAIASRERQLEAGERRYRTIFDATNDAIFIHDAETGAIDDVNQRMQQLYGCSHAQALNRSIEAFSSGVPPYSQKEAEAYLQQVENGGEPVFEWQGRNLSTGKLFPVEVSLRLAEIDGQRRILASVRDIAERKGHEQTLHTLRTYLENIIDSMPSILIGVDARGRVTQWNHKAEQVTGIIRREALGCLLVDLLPDYHEELNSLLQVEADQTVVSHAKVKRYREGQLHYEDITFYPLTGVGEQGSVVRIDDVTEQVNIEELMIQSEKMLSVGGLAAGMAHEINNPLAGVMHNIQVIKNRLDPSLPKNLSEAEKVGVDMAALVRYLERREIGPMMDSVVEAGKRAARIVQNMLSFSRKSEPLFAPCDLSALLDEAVELASGDYDLKKVYDFRQIMIEREYQSGLPEVACERVKLQQVFLNLLRNGAQAMRGAATEAPHFILRVYRRPGWVTIEIEDNGPGIDAAVAGRVFEPFFTTKGVGEGTGLGLSVSYFIIVENHRGELEVKRSRKGPGARFVMSLPTTTIEAATRDKQEQSIGQ